MAALRQRIRDANAFLVATPEYNHSYPAAPKFLLDSVYKQWQAKPVAFISYGGVSSGIGAVEHLRLVSAELHAVTIRDSVSFANAWGHFDSAGELLPPETVRKSMAVLLDRLYWWAAALREARNAAPYEKAAA